jgi:phytoene dehydrogenase-like protein
MKEKKTNDSDSAPSYDIIVVGAGPGGSAIGALLAKRGYKVLILDKNPRAGGRMMTFHKDGFYYELFPINCVPQNNSHFERILNEIGKMDEVEVLYPDPVGLIIYEEPDGNIRKWIMGSNIFKMLKTFGIRLWNLKEIFQSFKILTKLARMPKRKIDKLYDITNMDFMNQFKVPKGLYTYLLATFGEGAFEITSDKSSAAEMIKLFQEVIKNGGGRYYKNGIGYVFEVFAKAVQDFGGDVLFNTRVDKINVDGYEKVTGITTKNGKVYSSPIVISNAGIRQTVLKLIGESHFSKEYVDWIKNLEHNLACFGFRWFLNKSVLQYPTYVLYPEGCVAKYSEFVELANGKIKPEKSYIYLGTTSVYPGLTPQGKQLVYACMSCYPDPEIDIEPYLEYIEQKVKKILPELFQYIEKVETFGPRQVPPVGTDSILLGQGGESYGLSLSVGQTGDKQPKGDSPIKGLFHVGCDAGGSGLGTHQALDSALNVMKLVLEYIHTK